MQWCIYPTSQDGALTNWSHELPAATWWHVAVVNDSQHTTMYVDGNPVVRNPTTANRGLGRHPAGRSWLVGAKSTTAGSSTTCSPAPSATCASWSAR
ncbi:LamG-like jellyroll fold domain-containing protein [Clavibacter zhangzhiyongii]|uniref:LamG-like jellyroll fold domain-containing protein n=1 Tax=Clavibacter zhangzhiyongii TaxID=2768071 RepID=UPI0039E042A7